MKLLFFCFWIFVSLVQSQALLSVLQENFQLSTFNHYVNASSTLTNLLSSADNITLLAPSNTAFEAWLASQFPALTNDQIEALLAYHLIHGVFPTVSFSTQPQFAGSFLTNASYANVTGGQRVEFVLGSGGDPQIVSGNKSVTGLVTADILFTGGVIKIISSVLTIPLSYVILVTQADFSFVVAILNAGGYLSPTDTSLVNNVLYRPNMTFFAPNTQGALNEFSAIAPNMSQAELAATFDYHAVPNFLGYSSQLKNGMQLQTEEGTNVTITIQGNTTYVNGAKIITSDYLVANGVVHLIDSILDPSNTTGPPPLPSTSGAITPNPANPMSNSNSKLSSLSMASKVGVGVGVPLAIGSLAVGIYFLLRCMRRRKPEDLAIQTPNPRRSWVRTQNLRNLPPQELDGRLRENQSIYNTGQDISHTSSQSSRMNYKKWAVELDGRGIR